MTQLPPSSAAARLLDTAERLFFSEGLRATGVDTIAAESGVAKTTMYRHFPTKEDLMVAYLDVRDAKYFEWITSTTTEDHLPREAIQREIELLATAVTTPRSEGCAFLNAASEFSDPSHPVRRRVAKHKSDVVQHLRSLAEQAGIPDAQHVAEKLALLADGAYEAARVSGPSGPAAQYERLATGVLAGRL